MISFVSIKSSPQKKYNMGKERRKATGGCGSGK